MLNRNILALIGAAFALTLGLAAPAIAQDYPDPTPPTTGAGTDRYTGESGRSTRIPEARQERRNRNSQPATVPPTPEEIKAAAQLQAIAAGSTCQVSEATLLGVNAEQQPIYEAACAAGPGYILIGSTPAQAVDCVILAGQADIDRSRDPAANVGLQCVIPANADIVRVVSVYARDAGVPCAVDQGASIGKSPEGNYIYEAGCNGTDGYWIEQLPAGWEKTECLAVITQNGACRFTTPVEQAATVRTWLAGSAAAACEVTEARYMGANTNGSFYEAKCGAGDGYIARFDAGMAVQQIYPCAEAARIGGGCTLTVVPVVEAAPAPVTEE